MQELRQISDLRIIVKFNVNKLFINSVTASWFSLKIKNNQNNKFTSAAMYAGITLSNNCSCCSFSHSNFTRDSMHVLVPVNVLLWADSVICR